MASLMLRNNPENFMSYEYMMSVTSQGYPANNVSPHESSPSQSPESSASGQRIAPKLPSHHHHQQQQHHQQQFGGHAQDNPDLLRCKRRIQLGSLHHHHQQQSSRKGGAQPAAVARRNERERNRVRLVNLGFANLRQHVPNSSKSKKMSKVDTLRSAVEYIKKLQELLGVPEHSGDENSYPAGGQSSTGSPTPSLCSEASSPYMLQGDEDDDFIELASWL